MATSRQWLPGSPTYACALAGHGWRWPCAPKASTSEDEAARGVYRHGRSSWRPGPPRPSPAAASGFLVTPREASGCWTRWTRSTGGDGLFHPPRGGWAASTWRAPPGRRGRPPAPHPGRAPELQQVIDRDVDEVGIGGKPVSPRLRLSMHKIVANQLWDDEPPQTRQTARRLLALGYQRHDVPHMLGSVVAGESGASGARTSRSTAHASLRPSTRCPAHGEARSQPAIRRSNRR
jgi:hypothetical protein